MKKSYYIYDMPKHTCFGACVSGKRRDERYTSKKKAEKALSESRDEKSISWIDYEHI